MSPFLIFGGIALLGVFAASAASAKEDPNDPRTWPGYASLSDAEKARVLQEKGLPLSSDPDLARRLEGKNVLVKSPAASEASKKAPPQDPQGMPREYQDMVAKALSALTVDSSGDIIGPVTKEAIQVATQLAGRLEKAGWVDAANTVRTFAQKAAKLVPLPPPAEQVPLPPAMPPELRDRVQSMIQNERDPEKIEALIKALEKYSDTPEGAMAIQMLRALVVQIESANIQREALEKADKVMKTPTGEVLPEPEPVTKPKKPKTKKETVLETPPAPVPVPPAPVPKPELLPKTPAQVAAEAMAVHLRSVQSRHGMPGAKWKEDQNIVKNFQRLAEITSDGLAGPGTLGKAASLGVGELPLVMYWPSGTTRAGVQKYRDTLRRLADETEAQGFREIANSMRMSAALEQGQAGIVQTGPALT